MKKTLIALAMVMASGSAMAFTPDTPGSTADVTSSSFQFESTSEIAVRCEITQAGDANGALNFSETALTTPPSDAFQLNIASNSKSVTYNVTEATVDGLVAIDGGAFTSGIKSHDGTSVSSDYVDDATDKSITLSDGSASLKLWGEVNKSQTFFFADNKASLTATVTVTCADEAAAPESR